MPIAKPKCLRKLLQWCLALYICSYPDEHSSNYFLKQPSYSCHKSDPFYFGKTKQSNCKLFPYDRKTEFRKRKLQ